MPNGGGGLRTESYELEICGKKSRELAQMLYQVCDQLLEDGASEYIDVDMMDWYTARSAELADEEAREREREQRRVLKQRALDKLTDEERRVLGVRVDR